MIEVMMTAGAIRRAKLQSSRHHQQINTDLLQAGCPSYQQSQSTEGQKIHAWARSWNSWNSWNFKKCPEMSWNSL